MLKVIFASYALDSTRFTPMVFNAEVIFFAFFVVGMDGRIHHRFSERHGLNRLGGGRLVPNPSDTSSRLDSVENSVNTWSPSHLGGAISIAGVTSGVQVNTSLTGSPSTSTDSQFGTVTDLNQALKEIEGQSNSGIAQLSGSMATNSLVVELIRSNVSKLDMAVRSNISRIDAALNRIGEQAINGGASQMQTMQSQVDQMRSQLNGIAAAAGGSGVVQGFTQRISDLGTAVSGIDQRVAAIERRSTPAGAQSAEAAGNDPLSTAAGIPFIYQSWTGRVAIAGVLFGLVGMALSIMAITRLPKADAASAPADEQVLMEAGEGENAEGNPGEDGAYEEAAQEGEQAEQ